MQLNEFFWKLLRLDVDRAIGSRGFLSSYAESDAEACGSKR